MTFTDDDKTKLSFSLNTFDVPTLNPKVIEALLARLEAAEECIDDHRGDCLSDVSQKCSCGYADKLKHWHKVAGK